jgi:hypothetical protein
VNRLVPVSFAVAAAALALYVSTLLPGQDLGDTASFQAIAGSRYLTPRDAYPLYFAIGNALIWLTGSEPAWALNFSSALFAALACGMLAWVTGRATGSAAGAAFAGLLLASSFTFWSQATLAEVYSLHLFLVACSLAALLHWSENPSHRRLALFFGVYALSFGNHLMMILLLPGMAVFAVHRAGGVRRFLTVPTVAIAVAAASLGALQYAWNFSSLWLHPDREGGLADALSMFWFDVTKADWRESMMLAVHQSQWYDRLAMYWFDLRQQFGVAGLALAAAGAAYLLWRRPRVWMLLFSTYIIAAAFALTYNVGDPHVFSLPSHFIVALAAGAGAAFLTAAAAGPITVAPISRRRFPGSRRRTLAVVTAVVLAAYPAWRALDAYPSLDRSRDRRATELLQGLVNGLSTTDVFGVDLNWQLANGLGYYAKHDRPDLVVFSARELLPRLPRLIEDNAAIGRRIVLSEKAARAATDMHGPALLVEIDERSPCLTLADRVRRVPAGTAYVLTSLAPYSDQPVDHQDVDEAAAYLSGNHVRRLERSSYSVMAGRVGQPPDLLAASARPYRARTTLGDLPVEVRMESWLPAETFRRSGFGHVITGRRSVLTLDRGVSFVALEGNGRPGAVEYAAGLYAPQARYIVRLSGDTPTPE